MLLFLFASQQFGALINFADEDYYKKYNQLINDDVFLWMSKIHCFLSSFSEYVYFCENCKAYSQNFHLSKESEVAALLSI